MDQSNRLKERYRAFPLVCFIAVALGCGGRGSTEKEEIQTLYSQWRNGSIRESVSVTINGHTYCVDVVRNYREAKLGFAPLKEPMTEYHIDRFPDIEMSLHDENTLFVVLHKPFALRLPKCVDDGESQIVSETDSADR